MIRSLLFALMLLFSVSGLLISQSVLADVLTIRENAPQKYVVKKGDTLWDISGTFLNMPWRWPELWRKNEFINNPHLIYPGDVLHLLYDDKGIPYLAKAEKRQVVLSPHTQVSTKQATAQSSAIPAFSLQMLSPYLTQYHVVDVDAMEKLQAESAKVMGMQTGFDRGTHSQVAYVLGQVPAQQELAVIHLGSEIRDHDSEEIIGYELLVAAIGKAIQFPTQQSDLTSVSLSRVKREVLQGDFVVPLQSLAGFSNLYRLQASTVPVDAQIVKVASQGIEIGKYDIVVLDAGANDGLKHGDVLSVSRSSSKMFDATPPRYAQQLPAKDTALGRWIDELFIGEPHFKTIHLGEVLVLQVKPELSLAIVLNTRVPLRTGDSIRSL